jgi:hypothetical protein
MGHMWDKKGTRLGPALPFFLCLLGTASHGDLDQNEQNEEAALQDFRPS